MWRPRESQGWQNRWLLLASCVTRGADGGTSSNGDPIAPTLSAILGRGILTLAKCVVLRLSALFFADENPYHEKSPLKRVIFFDSLVPTAHLKPIYCPRKLKNSPLEMMVGFSLCSSLQIGFLSGDLLIFRVYMDVSDNRGFSPQNHPLKKRAFQYKPPSMLGGFNTPYFWKQHPYPFPNAQCMVHLPTFTPKTTQFCR